MITEGTICIWQNQSGEFAYLNGVETTVLKGLHFNLLLNHYTGNPEVALVYATDTKDHACMCGQCFLFAGPTELRPKNGPDEEEMDDLTEVMLIECGVFS